MRATRSNDPVIVPLALTAALLLILGCSGLPSPAASAATDSQDPTPEAETSEAEASEAAGEEPAAEEPQTYDNTIRWATASEVDNFGFDVFRSESEDGPFEQLNAKVIEGAGTADEPQQYQFVDDTIDPHKTYYYYVESISMSGVRKRFTPVGKAPPKLPPDEEEEETPAPDDG
ncbi:MAG: hypothetical protein V3T72_10445 [Thermoanaerobaculia bacterium]